MFMSICDKFREEPESNFKEIKVQPEGVNALDPNKIDANNPEEVSNYIHELIKYGEHIKNSSTSPFNHPLNIRTYTEPYKGALFRTYRKRFF